MKNEHHRKAENKLYRGTSHCTTHQMHILKQNDYYTAQVLIIAVCISLHVVEIQLEAACSFTSAMFEIFANLLYYYM